MEESIEKKYPPIAAHETGPGPGRYSLPPTVGYIKHDYTKYTSPAYTFHTRHSAVRYIKDSSPGPRYYVDSKVTRFGRNGSAAYSMLGRAKPVGQHHQTPGPGAYSPEKAPPLSSRSAPTYTMGSRTKYRMVDNIPAPNRYTLPSLLGSHIPNKSASPSYTISARTRSVSFSEDLSKTPGPGNYNTTDPSMYLQKQPAFSMLGRHSAARETAQTPGPGAYRPEKVTAHKPKTPAFSMGIRHSEFVTPLIIDVSD
ncbi:outer dense fiber protein 3-like protein 2 [Protopterus annectens]|uniref:outer dense fiber protein 3-like protein 2 n=1 Tax=Protopterus annectens TaxID=7888 RepID=UPI001CF96C8F|nr:outer dense fiber protein 3-like protein 2 [Protopterus annectens]